MRDIHLPGRSTVHGINGCVATSQPLATVAGLEVLQRGGNAVDAAVAASAALCVVEPMSTGIGGDCFVLYAPGGSGNVIGLNGSGRAPQGLSADFLLDKGQTSIGPLDIHSVTIPGAIDAWARLMQDHGTMSLEEVLAPAIAYAEEGFAVSPIVAGGWDLLQEKIGRTEEGRRHLLPQGRPPQTGERFTMPALAKTLRCIAQEGRAGFYEGWAAEDMVSFLQGQGGCHTLEDFAATRADYVDPIRTAYGPYDVLEIPPNGQGITALIMLNILSRFDLKAFGPASVERVHLEMEAQRLAFELRDAFVADQSFADVPVEALLSEGFTDRLVARISLEEKAQGIETVPGDLTKDTVYLSVIDKDQNAISFINSLYMGFGSGFVSPQSGVTFQNRGHGFVVDKAHPNCVEGGKRPKHTIIPAMLVHNQGPHKGKAAGSMGVMGGDYQPIGHTHVTTNMVDYGMDVQEALDSPRTFYDGDVLMVENTITEETRAGLSALGHRLEEAPLPFGGGQIAMIDWENGTVSAGSEPRKDGLAVAY